MIVFYKFPHGSTMFGNQRIYGYLERYAPVQIPWKLWLVNKDSLVAASYDKQILEQIFPGREFPHISFTYAQIRYLTWTQLCDLCKACNITTSRRNDMRKKKLQRFFQENC